MFKDGEVLHPDRALGRPPGKIYISCKQWGANYGVANGDLAKATIVGNVITAHVNDVQVLQATDNTYATGRPGMGFFLQGATGVKKDYGFTSFKASDRF